MPAAIKFVTSREILRAKEALQDDRDVGHGAGRVSGSRRAIRVTSIAFAIVTFAAPVLAQRQLRVCADPANLPFSNRQQQGFENRIAELIARDMRASLSYQWQRMGRGFVREFLANGKCDLVVGIPTNYAQMLTTHPYYHSTYVFVSRRSARVQPATFNDPELHTMKVGVQVLDDDYAPPAHALARRGMQANIVGFETTGADAPSIIRAVANRKVDTAVVWGPLAGYFAKQYPGKLRLTPVQPEVDPPGLPFTFAISMGVRKGNTQLRDKLQHFLDQHQGELESILRNYGVPLIEDQPAAARGN
jgi:mxaJ protein